MLLIQEVHWLAVLWGAASGEIELQRKNAVWSSWSLVSKLYLSAESFFHSKILEYQGLDSVSYRVRRRDVTLRLGFSRSRCLQTSDWCKNSSSVNEQSQAKWMEAWIGVSVSQLICDCASYSSYQCRRLDRSNAAHETEGQIGQNSWLSVFCADQVFAGNLLLHLVDEDQKEC